MLLVSIKNLQKTEQLIGYYCTCPVPWEQECRWRRKQSRGSGIEQHCKQALFHNNYKRLHKEKSNPVKITCQKREKSRFDEEKWFMCRDQNTKLWLFYTYILFVQTALRKISLKGQCHMISGRINFFISVFLALRCFSSSTPLVTNVASHNVYVTKRNCY